MTKSPAPGAQLEPSQRSPIREAAERVANWQGLFVVGVCAMFVFSFLNWPSAGSAAENGGPLLFLDTTPSGGDMGAHVWGPAYMRDHLLPSLRLTGWTPDWYAGFPAYQFYMVIPSLAIVILNAGFNPLIGIPLAAVVLYGTYRLTKVRPGARAWLWAFGSLLSLMLVHLPYGVSFKLVSVAGLLAFPAAAWAMASLARSPKPVAAFAALAGLVFLFDTNFEIYGGNIASTLAGEFAFSLSLCLSLLVIGVAIRGMDENRFRGGAAVLLALVALCHIIPVFFIIPALGVAVLADPERQVSRVWPLAITVALAIVPLAFTDGRSTMSRVLVFVVVATVVAAASFSEPRLWLRTRWMLVVGTVSILLTAFWLVPFYLREPYFNDMGWERKNNVGELLLTQPMKLALPVAAIGALLSYANRDRIGMVFTATGLVFASAVANLGEGALWNARLLPFYYLSVYMVAAVGVALVLRTAAVVVAEDLKRPNPVTLGVGTAAALVAVLVAVAMPLRTMPGGSVSDDGSYSWAMFTNSKRSFLPTWVTWNYSGYERKSAYREYANAVNEMARIGQTEGCGRAMWEYNKEQLDGYGTPMAMMLLPFWTDGCIGSMEGLYFESSATTPFHFLNQSMLSDAPSRAQRDLPYQAFDIERGVGQLQVMGVRYYMAITDRAIEAAEANPDLTRVGESQPFVIFEVAGSELVEPLAVTPVVVSGPSPDQVVSESRFDSGWLSQAVEFYNNPNLYPALPAESGPPNWRSEQNLATTDGDPVQPSEVSNIEVTTDSISFTVSQVGQPVLVKTSYFPNWKVDGADGPWRVGPNLMAVVPTETNVSLSYGYTFIDWFSILLTLGGIGIVVLLVRESSLLGWPNRMALISRVVRPTTGTDDGDEDDGRQAAEVDADEYETDDSGDLVRSVVSHDDETAVSDVDEPEAVPIAYGVDRPAPSAVAPERSFNSEADLEITYTEELAFTEALVFGDGSLAGGEVSDGGVIGEQSEEREENGVLQGSRHPDDDTASGDQDDPSGIDPSEEPEPSARQ